MKVSRMLSNWRIPITFLELRVIRLQKKNVEFYGHLLASAATRSLRAPWVLISRIRNEKLASKFNKNIKKIQALKVITRCRLGYM